MLDLKIPKGVGLFIIFYLLSTILLYNGFLPIAATSRLPLLFSVVVFLPIAVLQSKGKLSIEILFWGAGFMLVLLATECFHLLNNRNELISIISAFGILLFYSYMRQKSASFLNYSLILALAFYILLFYPLAMLNGMIGVGSDPVGSFVSKYLPGLQSFVVSANFPSGRGTFGLVGGTLLVLVYHSKAIAPKKKVLFYCLGVFALLASDSRGVILSLVLVLVLMLLPVPKNQKAKLVFVLPVVIILIQPLFFINIEYLLEQSVSFSRDSQSTEARTEIWPVCLIMIFTNVNRFLFGYGEAGSAEVLQTFFRGNAEEFTAAHNLFLQLFLNGGLLLFLSFLLLLLYICRKGIKLRNVLANEDLGFAYILIFLIAYGITGSLIDFSRINESMFIFIMSLSGLLISFRSPSQLRTHE